MERLESLRGGFKLPFWEGVKWWWRIRPKPLLFPRLPERLMSNKTVEWVKRRPKLVLS